MFVIAASETFRAEVTVDLLGDKGKRAKHKFGAIFRRPDQEEIDTLSKAMDAKEMTDQKIIDDFMVGWDGVAADAAGAPLEFTPENLERLLKINPTRWAIAKTFIEAIFGPVPVTRGN